MKFQNEKLQSFVDLLLDLLKAILISGLLFITVIICRILWF
jgi:hypothetical protein